MSKTGQEFVGLIPSKDKRPVSNFFMGKHGLSTALRDQLTISSWLCVGAIAQSAMFLLVGRLALIPALAVILYRVLDTYAMTVGWKHNHYMDDVIMKKFAAQFPDEQGKYGSKPADSDVVVFLIGTRCNHPMGVLAPGFKDFGAYFPRMVKYLDAHADEFGYLGMTSWLNMGERATGSEILSVGYFRHPEGLHKFAHSAEHREGWDWFTRHTKQFPHISIWHETFHAPKGHWENIAANSHANGINSTSFRTVDEFTGAEKWASPIVDASRGLLRTSAGRMSRSKGEEHDQYGANPYE